MQKNDHLKKQLPLIAHVVHRLDVGGLENGLVNIINRLPQGQFRHAIVCLTDYSDFSQRIVPPVDLYALHRKEGKDISLYWKLYRIFRQIRPDIVHTRNLATLEAQAPAWLAGVRYRIHGEHGWDMSDLGGVSTRYRKLRALFRPLIHCYIPLSEELETYLLEKVAVPEHKIIRIMNGVDIEKFYPVIPVAPHPSPLPEGERGLKDGPRPVDERGSDINPLSLWERVGVRADRTREHQAWEKRDDTIIIGTVGRLAEVKNQTALVAAFVQLITNQPELKKNVRLMLVGEGSLRPAIEKMIKVAGVTELVCLTGARDDVPELMRAMDIFVLPSLQEGISNTILEAMASGLPVIAIRVGGNSQLVIEGETGFLVEQDSLRTLVARLSDYIQNPPMRQAHAAAARKRAEAQFSLDGMVSCYQEIYQKGCEKN